VFQVQLNFRPLERPCRFGMATGVYADPKITSIPQDTYTSKVGSKWDSYLKYDLLTWSGEYVTISMIKLIPHF